MTIERALQYIDKVRSCYGTKNFTRDSYAASQWFNVVRKALEQESLLDKVRAEIEQEYNRLSVTRADETLELGECLGLKMALKIVDKYKAESEG